MTTPLREVALYHYLYLALTLEQGSGPQQWTEAQWQEQGLAPLRHWGQWLGQEIDPAGLPHPAAKASEKATPLFNSNGWQAGPGSLVGQALLQQQGDSLQYLLALGQEGPAGADSWPTLQAGRFAPPPSLTSSQFWLGQLSCYAAIIPNLATAQTTAETLLPGRTPLRCHYFDWGGWLFDRPGLPDQLALFYPDESAERAASPWLNDYLPALGLAGHKIAHQYQRRYREGLWPELLAAEQNLRRILHQPRPEPTNFREAQTRLAQIAQAYHPFGLAIGHFERVQQGIMINQHNLQQVSQDPAGGFVAALLAAADRANQQMAADRAFFQATIQETELTLGALQIEVDILRGQEEQRENELQAAENKLSERRNLLLGLVGLALALGEFVSPEATYQGLCWVVTAIGRTCSPAETLPIALVFLRLLTVIVGSGLLLLIWQVRGKWQVARGK